MIDRSQELLVGYGHFNSTYSRWKLPGRSLEFGGVRDPKDVAKWQGQPHDFIGFDEADGFLESQVRFLMGWNRTTKPHQRCRVMLCFNPPSRAEGRWLLQFFGPWIDRKHPRPAMPGELRWYAMIEGKEIEREDGTPFLHDGETILPRSRTFIPARITDNPHLMATGYMSQLQAMPEPLRSQLLYGDFDAGIEDDPWQVVPTAWIEAAMARWKPGPPAGVRLSAIGVDVARGGKDKTVIVKRYGNWFAPLDKHPGKSTPDGQAVANLISRALAENSSALVCIDAIGVGSSPVDLMKMLHQGRRLLPIQSGAAVGKMDRAGVLRFVNIRSYLWWSFRELLDPANGHKIALPLDQELLADVTATRWEMTSGGVKLESKDEAKKRLGRSPDCGDALVYSIAMPS